MKIFVLSFGDLTSSSSFFGINNIARDSAGAGLGGIVLRIEEQRSKSYTRPMPI